MTEVQGRNDPAFDAVRDELAARLAAEEELGAAIVVDVDGHVVVDIWGGWQDADRRTPWGADTVVNVWSSTKMVTALAVLMLVDRGLLDPYAPVARYWPEFAANGKDAVEVRHLLSHTSGVSGWDQPFQVEDMYDTEGATKRLAAQAPWWAPGTASGYHAQNQGHLLGELIRRTDGRSLTAFVAEEIAGPVGADFSIGARDVDPARIAPVVPPPPLALEIPPDSVAFKTFTGPAASADAANTDAWRKAELGALNGHGNARSLNRILKALALDGTVDGVRLLSPETIALTLEEQSHGVDLVLGVPLRFGIGFALPESQTVPYVPQGRALYWGGWGGSLTIADLDSRTTVSYVMNRMAPGIIGSDRSAAYVQVVQSCLT
ncbi:serine hydrolase domain-containing protein [Pseudonocardia sp. CA-107938]|uniref:serine hydrolase domain-containing protein n=1 Tax=Pseudonocardia sp. CA-107938 TaxID=3240021 RepID=UPI003D950410